MNFKTISNTAIVNLGNAGFNFLFVTGTINDQVEINK